MKQVVPRNTEREAGAGWTRCWPIVVEGRLKGLYAVLTEDQKKEADDMIIPIVGMMGGPGRLPHNAALPHWPTNRRSVSFVSVRGKRIPDATYCLDELGSIGVGFDLLTQSRN